MDHDALKDTQTDFYDLIDNRRGEPSESSAPEPRTGAIQNGRRNQHPNLAPEPSRMEGGIGVCSNMS